MMNCHKVNQANLRKVKMNLAMKIKMMSQTKKMKNKKNKYKSVSPTSTTSLIQTLLNLRYHPENSQLFNSKKRVNLNSHHLNLKNRF